MGITSVIQNALLGNQLNLFNRTVPGECMAKDDKYLGMDRNITRRDFLEGSLVFAARSLCLRYDSVR